MSQGKIIEMPTSTSHLERITSNKGLMISACDDVNYSFAHAEITFTGIIDGEFLIDKVTKISRFILPQPRVASTRTFVYEMTADGTLNEIFESFGVELDFLAFTSQEQIEKFAKEHDGWLTEEGYGTFFLLSQIRDGEKEYHCVYIRFNKDEEMNLRHNKLDYKHPRYARLSAFFVVPDFTDN